MNLGLPFFEIKIMEFFGVFEHYLSQIQVKSMLIYCLATMK